MSDETVTPESMLPRGLLAIHGALVALRFGVRTTMAPEEIQQATRGIRRLCKELSAQNFQGIDLAVSSLAALSPDFQPAASLYRMDDPRIGQEERDQIANPDVSLLARLARAMDEASKGLVRVAQSADWAGLAELSDTLEPLPWVALRRDDTSCGQALSDLVQRIPDMEAVLNAYER